MPLSIAWRYNRVMLAERFGWTLDYVDKLSKQDFDDILAVDHANQHKRDHDNFMSKT